MVVIHNVELQVVEEKSEVEVQESEKQFTDEDNRAEEADVTSDDQLDELVEIIDEFYFTAPISDQASNNVLVPI